MTNMASWDKFSIPIPVSHLSRKNVVGGDVIKQKLDSSVLSLFESLNKLSFCVDASLIKDITWIWIEFDTLQWPLIASARPASIRKNLNVQTNCLFVYRFPSLFAVHTFRHSELQILILQIKSPFLTRKLLFLPNFEMWISKFADKMSANNEGRLYS